MLGAVARALGTVIVFFAAIVLGFTVHLGVPAMQRAVVARINSLLVPVFAGQLTIDRVGTLGLTAVAGVDAHMDDPEGKTVIRATGIAGRVSTLVLVRSLFSGDIVVTIPEASLANAEVILDADSAGTLRIAKAFLPRTESTGTSPGPGVRLSMPRLHLDHVAVRGQPAGAPVLDGNVDDADGSLSDVPGKVAIDVTRARWAARGLPGGLDAQGDATAHLALPSLEGRDLGLRIATHVTVGTIAATADAAYDGGHLDATVDVPAATPEQARALWAPWPLAAPVSVHAEAHGALPQLTVRAHASLGAATLDLDGPVTVVPRLQASLHVDAKGIDARALAPSSSPPRTHLGASGDLTLVTKPDGAITVQAALDLASGTVGSIRTPTAVVTGQVTRAPEPGAEISATAKVVIHEPGAPTVVTAKLVPKKASFLLSFQVESNAPDLSQVAALGAVAKGRALAQADGTIDLGAGVVDARLSVAGEELEALGATAQAAHAQVHATGRLSSPALDVQVAGEGIEVWRLQCSSLSASAGVEIDRGLTLRDIDLDTRAADQRVHANARFVHIEGPDVLVEDAVVKGFGAPVEGTLTYEPGRLYVRARSGELDLARIARFVQVTAVREGRVGLDIDATVGRGVADGRVDFDVSHAAFGSFKDANARVEATLKGHEAAGHITASVADIGSIDVQSSSVQVGGAGALSASSWRRAWGIVDAKAHVDLPKLIAQLPPGSVPIRVASGVFDLTARIDRDSMNDASPAVDLTAATTGLLLSGGTGSSAWRIDGLDPTLHVTVDGDTGATALEVGVHDGKGPIATVDATSSAVPYDRIATGDGLLEALREMPFDARLSVPARSLESLPAALGLGDVHGTFRGSVEWQGAATKPTISADASLVREAHDNSASVLPFDFSITAHYDGANAEGKLEGINKEKIVLEADGRAEAKATDLLAGLEGAVVPWTGSARAKLDGMSLRAFTFLSDRQVRGKASGDLSLDRLHDDAHARAKLTFDGLTVGEVACRSAQVQATLDGHAFDASARFEQKDDDGFVDVRAHTGAHWGRAVVPALDSAQAADVIVSAKKFRAALLLPFVSGVFTQLDGRVDADARLDIDPATSAARPQGTISLTAGTFELVSLGGEFADVSGNLKMAPDGLIELENFVAKPLTGKVEAAATARLVGLGFAGARATVQVARNGAIPVVFDGVQMGTLDGHFDIQADPAPDHGLVVTISVPSLHMALPDTGTHDVQALGDLDGVTTGVHLGAAGFVDVPLDATVATTTGGPPRAPIKLDVRLGNEVQVTRGTDLDVRLQGEPIVTIGDDVHVSGQIRLLRGKIDVQGKPFTIDKGTVTFVGDDPTNPQVVLTAEWTAQDRTTVYADFVGPLKTGKVTLRSDPVLPGGQNDILALLIYGTTDRDASASSAVSDTSPFAGVAGSAAVQPINKALGGVNKALDKFGLAGGITAKIDTSTAQPRPEVEVQIARDISVQIAWVIGNPLPGTNPDSTLLTLDWRFARKWSLATTVGDEGTTILDLIWQHRY